MRLMVVLLSCAACSEPAVPTVPPCVEHARELAVDGPGPDGAPSRAWLSWCHPGREQLFIGEEPRFSVEWRVETLEYGGAVLETRITRLERRDTIREVFEVL